MATEIEAPHRTEPPPAQDDNRVSDAAADTGLVVQAVDVDADRDALAVALDLRIPPKVDVQRALDALRDHDQVRRVRLTGLTHP